ncbi:hypothetical protein JB92DRAFT_3083613 [Gautieria morchelliformis]|nr:hypothetical protein JB92DRAFT_3083613 [Gautieria morchelliformis]
MYIFVFWELKDAGHGYLNQTLILHGLLGTSPLHPEIAISIPTLELYRRCRLRCPHFSVQQWVRVLCDLANLNYTSTLREQFADAFDMHLDIMCRVHDAIKVQLGRDGPTWRLLHSCPPCQYKLEGEVTLNPSIMGALDGNNSLKRFIRSDRQSDTLTFNSDYFIAQETFDQFAHEVKRKVRKPNNDSGDPTDGDSSVETSMADMMKGMYNAFHETGIFISVCRHGLIWTIVDMIRSGELAKYPLATIARLLSVLPPGLGLGYDIACSFSKPLAWSSLGARQQTTGLRMVVPAFHGHAHNRLCQLNFHILMSQGFGLEDLETCERVFSASNAAARLTRHATAFHRTQFIDLFFGQWDADKYENLGRFLLNNYQQALEILHDMPVRLESLLPGRHLSDAHFSKWLEEERTYLLSKKQEPEENIMASQYVELLRRHDEARILWESSQRLTGEATRTNDKARLRQVTHDTWEGIMFLQRELQLVEENLDIGARWTPEHPDYQRAAEYLHIQKYQVALDKLEGLVVQRLHELTKANVSQTGYKLRMHISKALQTRSKAIQRALKAYNDAALALDPPRQKLTWSQIVEYTTLAEFELLHSGARQDIRNLDWAEARHREATICHLKMRLNVEIRRLATWMSDDEAHLEVVIAKCQLSDPLLAKAIMDFMSRLHRR